MKDLTIAQIIAKTLHLNGVERIYGLIGTSILDFIDTLYDFRNEINLITTRHEQVAVSAADGEARTKGNIGVAAVHAGPGFLNSMISLAISMKDRVPVLLITGGVRRRLRGTDAWLEINQGSLARSLQSNYFLVERPNEILDVLFNVFDKLYGNPRLPAVLEIAEDIWKEKISLSDKDLESLGKKNEIKEEYPKDEIVKETFKKLKEAKKPLILACGELTFSKKFKEDYLIEVAEKTGSYIITSGNGRGACSEDNPRSLGRAGFGGGNLVADNALENCDFLLVLGNEFDDTTTYAYTLLPEGETYVISQDPSVEKRPRYYELFKHDPSSFLEALKKEAEKHPKENKNAWDVIVEEYKKRWNSLLEEALSRKYENVANPSKFFKALDKRLPKNRIISGGQGVHIVYTYDFIKIYKPRTFLASTNLGAMGFALPAAMGAKLANPDAEVLAVLGDGEFMMTVQDLETIKRENIALKTIIVNDNSYRVLYLRQLVQKAGRIYETLLTNPDFVKLSESFGINATKVSKDEEIEKAIEEMLMHKDEPFLVELVIDVNDVPPMNIQQTLKMSM